jgi:hypothetical protein
MAEASPNRGVLIALAYLWLLALVPLLASDDEEVKWHAKHGLLLAAAEFLLLCGYVAFTTLVGVATLGLGFILVLLIPLAWIGILALHALAIVKGINGARLSVPVVSELTNRF